MSQQRKRKKMKARRGKNYKIFSEKEYLNIW
jgi:hypothetical protein